MYNIQFIVLLTFSLLVIFAEMHVSFFATRSSYFVPLLNTSEPIFYKTMINDGNGFNNSEVSISLHQSAICIGFMSPSVYHLALL